MQFRASLTFVLIAAAAACTATGDGPTAVAGPDVGSATYDLGVRPPPPLGSEETDIDISAGVPPTTSGPSAAFSASFFPLSQVAGRYFANTQSTNAWIQFVTNNTVVASPNARLQYNQKTGRTTGQGTLTLVSDGTVLDLSTLTIVGPASFGSCPNSAIANADHPNLCASAAFLGGGSISVSLIPPST